MKKTMIAVLTACALFGCASEPVSVRMVLSEMQRYTTAADLDSQEGRLKWNYTTGLELLSFLDAAKLTAMGNADCGAFPRIGLRSNAEQSALSPSQEEVLNYVDAWYNSIINEDGSIGANYKRSNYSLDHVCPARTLFSLYQLTGRQKYRAAMDSIYAQIQSQPRTEAGAFWHKKIYPHQVWLDGLYMAHPFYAAYSNKYLSAEEADANYTDIAAQFRTAYDKCYDPATRLLRHAWDESKGMFWADPNTGQSQHAWGRALGWYAMALVDVLDFVPEDHPARNDLTGILRQILDTLPGYADPETGMWYQVLDCPGREGNYIESTCSAMFTYVYLKSAAKGYAPEYARYARRLYRKLVRTFIREDADGTVTLTQCCAVAGLGGKQNRSGDYEYYIHETITENDPKGVGPFIWASLCYENGK